MATPLPPKNQRALGWPLLLLALLLTALQAGATHIRAGNILAKGETGPDRNPLKFHFTLVTYTVAPPAFEDLSARLYFGDCTSQEVARTSRTILANGQNNTLVNEYHFEHTFPGPGTYTVTYVAMSRNMGVVNLNTSVQQVFTLQTTVTVDPFLGVNRSPMFSQAPLEAAVRNQTLVHNPVAYDPDGDSLAYKLVPLKTSNSFDPCGNPVVQTAPGFRGLEHFLGPQQPGSPTGYTLDPITGQLTWNTPGILGEYNIALGVEEWRDGRLIGQIVRDMQLLIGENGNRPPVITAPRDTCAVASTLLQAPVMTRDPDNDPTIVLVYGEMMSRIEFPRVDDVTRAFQWQPRCEDVRRAPYQVVFRAEDQPSAGATKLAHVQTWNVTVVAPPPVLLSAVPQGGNSVRLTWQNYTCPNFGRMYIYRKVNASAFSPTACQVGIPASAGYTLVGTVPAGTSTFLDNNNGQGLDLNQQYHYRIYAAMQEPAGGSSLASNEVAVSTLTGTPEGQAQQLTFRPNPATDLVTIEAPASVRLLSVQAVGVTGKKTTQLKPLKAAHGWTLDVRALPPGLHLLYLQTDQGPVVHRLVIKR
ncbi:T9SS type A sorting domain-containing protein [Rufibacter psychrotolerans]|uniref:T9SS type A sorting domain-containing protein n=1 Tax=Rufibacter psychrotolerans TaxID=2812556 RepID=UPI0019672EA6|nr:T9SS type A sorting domain-containing protein [Rufibacter sp. SYSU D00308]